MPGGCSPPARAESWEGPGNRGWSSSEQEGSGRADTRAVHSWGLPRLHGLEIPVRTRVSDGEEEEERRGAGAGGEEPRAVWPRALRGKGGPRGQGAHGPWEQKVEEACAGKKSE